MKRILTIAASDSGGGAGIQADIKTITVLGGFAMSAVTALTAQNTVKVESIHPVPSSFIEEQIDAVLLDIGADAVKTGMLFSADIIDTVGESLGKHHPPNVVVDPVMKSTAGDILLEQTALHALKTKLFPLASMVTPNLDEASVISDMKVDTVEAMKEAAKKIHAIGVSTVLIKGGHLKKESSDLFYDGREFSFLPARKIDTKNTHGTGCTLSAAIATELAKGRPPLDAVKRAKDFITTAIRFSLPIGHGHGPTNPFASIERDAQIFQCCEEISNALIKLKAEKIGSLMPEVQSNFGYALPSAELPEDVIAIPGRIIRIGTDISTVSYPRPGASRHIAKIILTALRYDRRFRSAMNIVYHPAVIECCKALGMTVCEFNRKEEPPEIKECEGSTLEWGVDKVISQYGKVPDVIFDTGDFGKEPMTRILGTDPLDVAMKVITIAKKRNQTC